MEKLSIYDAEQDQTYIICVTPDIKDQISNGNLQVAQELLLTAQKRESFRTAFQLMHENNEVPCDLDSPSVEKSANDTSAMQQASEAACSTGLHSSSTERSNMWDKSRTLLLMSKALAKKEKLESPRYKKGEIFKEIAHEMRVEANYSFTGEQCQNRMKTLITKYKAIKDHNNTTGNDAKEWEYFDFVQEYLGDRPSVTPKVSCSSLALIKPGQSTVNDTSEPPTKQRKIRHSTPRNEMLKWLKEQARENKDMEERRLEQVSQQHKENTELFRQFLELIKKKNTE